MIFLLVLALCLLLAGWLGGLMEADRTGTRCRCRRCSWYVNEPPPHPLERIHFVQIAYGRRRKESLYDTEAFSAGHTPVNLNLFQEFKSFSGANEFKGFSWDPGLTLQAERRLSRTTPV